MLNSVSNKFKVYINDIYLYGTTYHKSYNVYEFVLVNGLLISL